MDKPSCCSICGDYLTISEEYSDQRCLDPGHWQAAGLLATTDFYAMARIVAQARSQLDRRPDTQ